MTEQLNTILTHITSTSIDTFHKLFEENIILSFNKLHDKIKEDISINIMHQIKGDTCYDYSLFPEIQISNTHYYLPNDIYKKKYDDFIIMKKNEKIIWTFPCNGSGIFLTNNGKIMYNKVTYDSCNRPSSYIQLQNHEFWIPIDYINIIIKLTLNIPPYYSTSNNEKNYQPIDNIYTNMNDILVELKLSLFSNKFIPSYIKEENENMKLELMSIRKEKELYDIEIKPYIDLINDRVKLDEERAENIKEIEEQKFLLQEEKDNIVKIYEDKLKTIECEHNEFKKEKAQLKLLIIKYNKDNEELKNARITLDKELNKLEIAKLNFEQEKMKAYSLDICSDSDSSCSDSSCSENETKSTLDINSKKCSSKISSKRSKKSSKKHSKKGAKKKSSEN